MLFRNIDIDVLCDDYFFLLGIESFISTVQFLYKNTTLQQEGFSFLIYADTSRMILSNKFNDIDIKSYDYVLFILPDNKIFVSNTYTSQFNCTVMKSTVSLDDMMILFYQLLFNRTRILASSPLPINNAHQLSEREKKTINLLVSGCDYIEISVALGVKIKTVSCYCRSAIKNYGFKSLAELISFVKITPSVLTRK